MRKQKQMGQNDDKWIWAKGIKFFISLKLFPNKKWKHLPRYHAIYDMADIHTTKKKKK